MDDEIRRFVVEDSEQSRFEDAHIDPFVQLRRISSDPAIREVTFPPNASLAVHSHPCDTLYVIQSGEFIVDGEGSYRPGELRWVKGGVTYGPERAGPEVTTLMIVSTNGPFGLRWGHEGD